MLLNNYIAHTQALVNDKLDQLIQVNSQPQAQLFAAARYSLLGSGKRLRPLLTIATAKAFGTPPESALTAASAIEMIHTYSMIHDDLPCMDDDDFRRGKPTLHKAFPEAHAVLAGDFLLTFAFEILVHDPLLSPLQKVALVSLLAKASGGNGMIAGQIMDIEAEGQLLHSDQLQLLHRYKTGALITAAVQMGGVVANASAEELFCLKNYGEEIGLAFQIVDDILDLSSSEQKHGKNISSDILKDKMTYVKLYGIEGAKEKACALIASAKKQLASLPGDTAILNEMADLIVAKI